MLRKVTVSAVLGLFLLLGACSKNTSKDSNDNTSSSQLVGTYQFAYLTTDVSLTEVGSVLGQSIKVVGSTGYTTTQNTGTVVFTADSAKATNIGYAYDAPVTTIYYQNNVPVDTTVDQSSDVVAPTSSSSKYQIIGADSIYFPGGVLGLDQAVAASPVPITAPTGGHFTIKGDSLIITTKLNTTFADSYNGIPTTATINFTGRIALKKQ